MTIKGVFDQLDHIRNMGFTIRGTFNFILEKNGINLANLSADTFSGAVHEAYDIITNKKSRRCR